jgi:biotin-dependent carboxylase-like uncharacterized protein
MTLRVLDPGLYTLLVDYGRPHHRSFGVSLGGAADRAALALGNALVGNDPNQAALEITLAGPTLRADCNLACVIFGAPFDVEVSGQRRRCGKTFTLQAGQVLEIGSCPRGARAYFCVRGGLEGPHILGSRSGLEPVRKDHEIGCAPGSIHGRFLSTSWQEDVAAPFRVLPGPQAHCFDRLLTGRFTVAPASNRMGIRLKGEPLQVPAEMVSEPVCPGAVQVTRDGQCIILGVDGQTIGGYPKIAQVISADLDRLGQLRPGDEIGLEYVSLETAEYLYRLRQAELAKLLLRLRTTEMFAASLS